MEKCFLVLELNGKTGSNHVVEVNRNVFLIGRETDCALRIADDSITRRHCKIERRGSAWVISDLRSSNGTFVNDERIGAPREIGEGDVIQIGQTRLQVSATDQVLEGPTTAAGQTVELPSSRTVQ